MALPAREVYRALRALDANPFVTHDSQNPDTLEIRMFTETGVCEFVKEAEKGDRLRYLLGRALDPANTPSRLS